MVQSINGVQGAEEKKRSREYYIILAIVSLVGLLTYVESHVSIISGDIPVATNLFVLGLININIILIVTVIFLIVRNAVKLFFSSRRHIMGSKLQTKLVSAFVALTIVPTLLLFFVVIGFVNRSIDSWFAIKVEDSLKGSLELAQNYYKDMTDRMLSGAWRVSKHVSEGMMPSTTNALSADEKSWDFFSKTVEENGFSTVEVRSATGERLAYAIAQNVNKNMVPDLSEDDIKTVLKKGAMGTVQTLSSGDVIRGMVPAVDSGGVAVVVAVSYYVPKSLTAKMSDISSAFDGYRQLKMLKNPVKASYFTVLLIITLVIVFFSIWIGQYLAKAITVPIFELAEGTHAVASGNLDFRINVKTDDEIGLLVKSFNRMTEDLKSGKSSLEYANKTLRSINTELESRRNYIETVLGNIPAGVMSIDRGGNITSLNRVAAEMLSIKEADALGKNYIEALRPEERQFMSDMISEINGLGAGNIERQMVVRLKDREITVLVNLNALRDLSGAYMGVVAVFDDLTHLLKTQRMVAWKEVARRIAHEIKNPLTPIQLSAQRLRKKYMDKIPDDRTVFDECTKTIISQVDELKTLVNEFSSFARMPAVNPALNDLNEIVRETLALYRAGHRSINFLEITDPALPAIELDREQIKRVIINLIDNAVDSIGGEGTVEVETRYDGEFKLARLTVSDTGCGIPPGDRARLFEPYFSTKKSGTGLGLAIVSTIISDHNGYIRVKDNSPRGTRFVIELPVKAVIA